MLKMVQHVEKPILGIDVGTSNTCAAVWVNNHVNIVVDDMGNSAVPSFVGFTSMERLVGEAAKACQVAMNPRNTIFDVKKLIGRRFEDSSQEIEKWPFTVVQWEGQPHYKIEVGGSGRLNQNRFTPQAIASMIIGKMKEMAESYLGQGITEAVLSVPIYFDESQRKAVREAGSLAGLNVLGLVDEATATALTYARGKMFKGKRNILIFDWGGGSLSVHVLVVTMDSDGTHVEVKATVSHN
jgi:heat shock protein 1/8